MLCIFRKNSLIIFWMLHVCTHSHIENKKYELVYD